MITTPIADLELRLPVVPWWSDWGQTGLQTFMSDRSLTPASYYGALLVHMINGGEIPPLLVGPWVHGKPGQLYVHDGTHRFLIARSLGWTDVPTEPADDAYINSPAWRNVEWYSVYEQ